MAETSAADRRRVVRLNWFDLLINWAVRSSDMAVTGPMRADHRQRAEILLHVGRTAQGLLALGIGPIVLGPLQIFLARSTASENSGTARWPG